MKSQLQKVTLSVSTKIIKDLLSAGPFPTESIACHLIILSFPFFKDITSWGRILLADSRPNILLQLLQVVPLLIENECFIVFALTIPPPISVILIPTRISASVCQMVSDGIGFWNITLSASINTSNVIFDLSDSTGILERTIVNVSLDLSFSSGISESLTIYVN